MELKPIGQRVIVRPNAAQEKSKGGLIFGRQEAEKQDTGVVVAVGGDMAEFAEGQTIVYQKYGPVSFKDDNVEYVIVHLDEILARVEGAA